LVGWSQLASTRLPLSFFTTSCSSHAHSTDQKHQKQSKFPSSFSKVLFIYLFLKFLDFMICNGALNKYVVGKELIKIVDEKGEKMQMVEEGRKRKYEITTNLLSERERHILGL
jgi:uncharacterized ion transporter superfamily protein YfcC